MLEKTFRPDEVEPRLYDRWEQAGAFAAGRKPGAKPYCIVIPPPNVTGSLHMGHALNNTLQDVLVRFERMRGRDVLWQPGTDHAGIATQIVVERQLALQQTDRHKLGRDKFIERVWQWKAESGSTITRQLRRLGCSCDWSRERFTMDPGLSEAVTEVFVALYRDGLIYKDKRLVNWDPKLLTAVSDLEVIAKEIQGSLWHFKYPIENRPGQFITVATTRPETMLGDTAVAVHPDDPRYQDLIGQRAILPLVGRRIPIVADEYADPEQGSGAVKITPAHDFNDFEVGRRHDLALINIFDAQAHLNDAVPERYRGLDRYTARARIVVDLETEGLLAEIEPHSHLVPHCERTDEVIEPWLTDQWYVDAKTLAKAAIEAVERGETVFVPRNWEKTYFQWMHNIEPWCISRQLWWGHQIPAWYAPDGEIFVAHDEAAAKALAREKLGRDVALTRDPDVLDTWFSSQLWPFSTLGWPQDDDALKRFYPTDVLVTGFDIIFFWVARMMMAGLHFMGEVPFKTVYIHALVRDEKGAKMSKSKGNVLDPLDLVDSFGADALRMTLAAMAAQGRDIKLSKQRIEGYRNFGTKLWNAARFCQINDCVVSDGFDPANTHQTVNRWILGALAETVHAVTEGIEAFKFNDAADAIYHFTWGVFCDWYLEFIKPLLGGADEAVTAETRATAAFVLDRILALLHPFMPFITEELWDRLGEATNGRAGLLMLAEWPKSGGIARDTEAMAEMDWVIRLVNGVRSVRAEMNVPAGAQIPLVMSGALGQTAARLDRHRDLILRLSRASSIKTAGAVPPGAIQLVVDEATLALPLADVIDLAKERARLERELDKLNAEIGKLTAKLDDPKFVSRAPEAVVEESRERLADSKAKRDKLAEAVERLKSAA